MHIRKLFIVSLAALLLPVMQLSAQNSSKQDDDDSCYRKWYRIFKLRGADEVTDGEYDNVVISFRQGTHGNCYYGKCVVKKGKVKEVYIKVIDGKYEKVEMDPKEDILIANGISDAIVAKLKGERQVLNVIFKDKLRPKGNSFEQAPDPDIDDFN
jgi:hypothetical protein